MNDGDKPTALEEARLIEEAAARANVDIDDMRATYWTMGGSGPSTEPEFVRRPLKQFRVIQPAAMYLTVFATDERDALVRGSEIVCQFESRGVRPENWPDDDLDFQVLPLVAEASVIDDWWEPSGPC
jgi:hypothetical protein